MDTHKTALPCSHCHRAEPSASIPPIFVSRKDAAVAMAISLRAVAYLIANGELKTRKIGGRTLIAVDELKRFARADHRSPIVAES